MATSTTNIDEDIKKVAIVGSGLIGRSWAMIFASAGFKVTLFDIESAQISNALTQIRAQLEELSESGLLRGELPVNAQIALIQGSNSMSEGLNGVSFVQECVVENLEVKKKVFSQMEEYVGDDVILSSSSSGIMPSKISETLKRRNQCLVSHPLNPPYFVPLVEITPAPWTDQSVTDRTRALMERVGQVPIILKKEVPGFASSRIQYPIIAETWRLIEQGVVSVDDADKIMWAGLGARYAFLGPLEVMHLNADGIRSCLDKYGKGIDRVLVDLGPYPPFPGTKGLQQVEDGLNAKVPIDKLAERRQWRDARLAALSKLKRNMDKQGQ